MPFFPGNAAGNLFGFVAAFAFGIVSSLYYSSTTEMNIYQPNVVRVVYEPKVTTVISYVVATTPTQSTPSPSVTLTSHTTRSAPTYFALTYSTCPTDAISMATSLSEPGDIVTHVQPNEATHEPAPNLSDERFMLVIVMAMVAGFVLGLLIVYSRGYWFYRMDIFKPERSDQAVQTLPVVPRHGTETFHSLHLHRHRRLKEELDLVYERMWKFEDQRNAFRQDSSETMDANVELIRDLTRISRERDGNKQTFEKELRELQKRQTSLAAANKGLVTGYFQGQKSLKSICKELAVLQGDSERDMSLLNDELTECKEDLKESQANYAALLCVAEIEQNEAETRYEKAKAAACGLDIDMLELTVDAKRLRAQITSKDGDLHDLQLDLNRTREELNTASLEKRELQREIQALRSGLANGPRTFTVVAGGSTTIGLARPNPFATHKADGTTRAGLESQDLPQSEVESTTPRQNAATERLQNATHIGTAVTPKGGSSSGAKQPDLITFSPPRPKRR